MWINKRTKGDVIAVFNCAKSKRKLFISISPINRTRWCCFLFSLTLLISINVFGEKSTIVSNNVYHVFWVRIIWNYVILRYINHQCRINISNTFLQIVCLYRLSYDTTIAFVIMHMQANLIILQSKQNYGCHWCDKEHMNTKDRKTFICRP